MELAQWIASGRTPQTGFKFRPKPAKDATAPSLVDDALAQLGLEVSPATRQRLVDYLNGGAFGSESWYEMKLRGLYALLLSLPEYQVH
jgi:DNA polymerase III delta subunit